MGVANNFLMGPENMQVMGVKENQPNVIIMLKEHKTKMAPGDIPIYPQTTERLTLDSMKEVRGFSVSVLRGISLSNPSPQGSEIYAEVELKRLKKARGGS